MTKILLFTAMALCLSIHVAAQNLQKPSSSRIATLPLWAQKMYGDQPNVFEVDSLYKSYYQQHAFVKSYDTQYYKRWRRSLANNVSENGTIIELSASEKEQIRQEYLNKQTHDRSSSWSVVGPITNFQEGGTQGSGQTNVYSFDQCLGTPAVCYCGTEPGEVYKTTDGGLNWTQTSLLEDFGSGVTAVEVHPVNPLIVFAGGNYGIFRSIDGGATWVNVLPESNFGANEILINPANDQQVLVASDKGLYRSINGGASFTLLFSNKSYDIKANTANSSIMYLVRNNPNAGICEFASSTDAGATWTVQSTGWYTSTDAARNDGGARLAVTPANSNRVYAYLIGESKPDDNGYIGIYRSDDGGASWTLPSTPIGGPYSATHQNLAIGYPAWQYWQGFYNCALMASATDADEILVGGLNLFRSVDGGLNFTPVAGYIDGSYLNMHVDMQDFRMIGSTAWITTDGGIYQSTDLFTTEPSFKMSGVHGSDYWGFGSGWNEDVLVGGLYHNGNLAHHENYGAGNFLELGGGEAPTGYVNPGNNRKTYFSDINGKMLPLNLNDPIANASFGMSPNESYGVAESSELEFHPNCYSIAYIGKENALWKTTDGGGSFNLVHTFGTNVNDQVKYIEIASSNPNVIYLNQQTSAGTLWKTTDGGQTWNSLTIPNGNHNRMLLTIDPQNENTLWIAYPSGSNGNKIYKTIDGGTSWTNVTGTALNNESIHHLVHIAGTDGGLYAATNNAVYYRNNSTNWQIDNAGLPTFTSGNILRPFYRDGKIRLATYGKGIWESQLSEAPTAPIARIMVDKMDLEVTCAIDSFYFEDYSFLNHDNASWSWQFPTGSPSTSTERNPAVSFSQAGDHLAILTITDGNGQTDVDSLTVNVSFFALPLATLQEDFQGNFLPNGWSITDYDNDGQWSLSAAAGGYGSSSQSTLFDNYNINGTGNIDDLVIPLDAAVSATELKMYFDVAYARWGSGNSDSLSVHVSTDCGETFQQVYYKGGTELSTSPDNQNLFVPTANEWRTDTVDLSAFIGENNLQIAFRNHGYYGNAIYLDNINIGGDLALNEQNLNAINLFPNPVKAGSSLTIQAPEQAQVHLIDLKGRKITSITTTANGTVQFEIPGELSGGTYILQIKTADKIWNKQLVILK